VELSGPDGTLLEPEDLPAEMAPHLWAARVITAAANGDDETQRALLKTVIRTDADPAQVIEFTKTLVGVAATAAQAAAPGATPRQLDDLMDTKWAAAQQPTNGGQHDGGPPV
jgi:hypothetical protein